MPDRLVVMDDEIELARFVGRVGESVGYEVKVTSHARDFKDNVARWNPSVIILDLAMPETDGLDLLRWLASQNCRAQIVIMSGFDTRVLEAAKRIGLERGLCISCTINKPARVQEMKEIFQSLRQEKTEPLTETDLQRAFAQDELFLLYQPKIALKTGALQGAEALIYWNHPTRGVLGPDMFIALTEEKGLIDALTDIVLVNVIRQQKKWKAAGLNLHIAVNLSPLNLQNDILADRIVNLCNAEHVPADCIVLEVTESVAMDPTLEVLDTLTRLRLKGFSLSIDDFGTGFSSFTRLQRLPVTEVKIDRSFVMGALLSNDALVIVKTIIDLARNMHIHSVAEGIETMEHYHLLAELGCELGQGYAIAKPLTADEFFAWHSIWKPPATKSGVVASQ